MKKNIWLDGMMGLVVGDALGVPVQFFSREEIKNRPEGLVTGMEAGGVYNMPKVPGQMIAPWHWQHLQAL